VAVRLVVYGSVRGSVRLSGNAAVRLVVYGSARGSAVRLCGSGARGSVRQCVAVCGSAHSAVSSCKCVAVRFTYIYTKSLTIHIPLQGRWE